MSGNNLISLMISKVNQRNKSLSVISIDLSIADVTFAMFPHPF